MPTLYKAASTELLDMYRRLPPASRLGRQQCLKHTAARYAKSIDNPFIDTNLTDTAIMLEIVGYFIFDSKRCNLVHDFYPTWIKLKLNFDTRTLERVKLVRLARGLYEVLIKICRKSRKVYAEDDGSLNTIWTD
jgi:hypothetical protein